jgi:hypothetical protein
MTEPSTQHPDIEIYVKGQPLERITAWLTEQFGPPVETDSDIRNSHHFLVQHQSQQIPVMVVEKAIGSWTSIWFDSGQTPWNQDINCARDAFLFFNAEVRCIANGWQEGAEPDEWWSIKDQEEGKMIWRN